MNRVNLSTEYFPNPTIGRALSGANIYVGVVDLDPEVPANQKQISVLQEDGSTVQVSQPLLTGAGGVPLYNASPVTILVDGSYSIKVTDSAGAQVYYVPKNAELESIVSFDSIADLRAITDTPTDGDTFTLLGYYTPGDGGGGSLYWDSTSTEADDGIIIFKVTAITTGRFKRINQEYISLNRAGAIGDGVTDYTTRMQAAQDTGQIVHCEPGTYLYSAITYTTASKGWKGTGGKLKTIFQADSSAVISHDIDVNPGLENFLIDNIWFKGHANSTGCIKLGGVPNYIAWTTIKNCRVSGYVGTNAYGIGLWSVQEVNIENCNLNGNYDNIYRPNAGYCTSTVISGPDGYIGNATNRGFHSVGVLDDITFNGKIVFEGNEKEAIYSTGKQSDIYLDNVYFELNNNSGLAEIYVLGGVGAYEESTIHFKNIDFHATNGSYALSIDEVTNSLVQDCPGLLGLGIQTTANTQCHFVNCAGVGAIDPAPVYGSLLGQITAYDRFADSSSEFGFYGDLITHGSHIKSLQTTAPTITATSSAGTGATVTITAGGTDNSGIITLLTGTAATGNGTIFTITFNKAFTKTPHFVMTPNNGNSALGQNTYGIFAYANATTTAIMQCNNTLPINTTFTWSYHVVE